MKVTVLDDYQDSFAAFRASGRLRGTRSRSGNDHCERPRRTRREPEGTEALVLHPRAHADPRSAHRAPRQAESQQQRSVYPHIEVEACTRKRHRGVVGHEPGKPSHAAAELTWRWCLRRCGISRRETTRLKKRPWQSTIEPTARAHARHIRYGRIGAVVASYGKAFGMPVVAWGREGSLERARADGHEVAASKADLFAHADVLSLHLRLIKETRGIVTATDLARMKPDALLVNTSRAELIEPGALVAALQAGRPWMAAVDVYEEEPCSRRDASAARSSERALHAASGVCRARRLRGRRFASIFDRSMRSQRGSRSNVRDPKPKELGETDVPTTEVAMKYRKNEAKEAAKAQLKGCLDGAADELHAGRQNRRSGDRVEPRACISELKLEGHYCMGNVPSSGR